MRDFAELFTKLDQSTKTNVKIDALSYFFDTASDEDKLWAIALLSHRRPKRPVNTTLLRMWAAEQAGIPLWLFEESYHVVGDLAETIALVLPAAGSSDKSLAYWVKELINIRGHTDEEKKIFMLKAWQRLSKTERFIFNKLLTGGFRVGVSQKIMVRGLARSTGIDENILAHKLTGEWNPQKTTFRELLYEENKEVYLSKPYPFYLAYMLDVEFDELGSPDKWQAEYKWDGIRGQLIKRETRLFIWSRGEELVTDRFPEYHELNNQLPDGVVIDGEILAWKNNRALDFKSLQTRLGRKNVSKKLMSDVPVILMAYDLLEYEGEDTREWPLEQRRKVLHQLVKGIDPAQFPIRFSDSLVFESWKELASLQARSRETGAEGVMLKRLSSPYRVGRKRGDWWKWKVDPFTIDAVLTYAMRGHGRRANLYTDYTFGLWQDGELVTVAKAYSGLTDAEIREVDRFVKQHTQDRFGPVRMVEPQLVFELAFENIAASKRHKSGVAVRFPRIQRWRKDKKPEDANSLNDLKSMIPR